MIIVYTPPSSEKLVEYLHMAAEYAGIEVEFAHKPSERDGCCFVTWGTVEAPHEAHRSQQEVHIRLALGKARSIPDKAKWEDFAECLACSPKRGAEVFPKTVYR